MSVGRGGVFSLLIIMLFSSALIAHERACISTGPQVEEAKLQVKKPYADFVLVLRAAVPPLRKTGTGRIIAIGSRAALEPGAGVGACSASKAAMVSLLKTVALENKDAGPTANVILPRTMDTPANRKAIPNADVSKWVQPASVAELVAWLASEAGKDVNGSVIPVR